MSPAFASEFHVSRASCVGYRGAGVIEGLADSGHLGGPMRHPAGGRWGEQRWPEDRKRGHHSPAGQQSYQHGCEGAGVIEGLAVGQAGYGALYVVGGKLALR